MRKHNITSADFSPSDRRTAGLAAASGHKLLTMPKTRVKTALNERSEKPAVNE
jgi:hypothetical protein